jgi:hypothetical protein
MFSFFVHKEDLSSTVFAQAAASFRLRVPAGCGKVLGVHA